MPRGGERGRVWIVGAGPGAPDLVTIRGAAVLATCDVVLYDRLASPRLVALAPSLAKRIDVGKRADGGAQSTERQEEINDLLVEHARKGLRVVRLHGGDPFLFGRGGEEAEALAAAGVAYEIVPGVTAGVAAAACAGFPITQRGLASAVAFVTGHEDATKQKSALDYAALAHFPGTLVFYMAVARLDAITSALVENGRDPEEPAVVIEQATTAHQRTVEGPLGEIAARAKNAKVEPPAIFVTGEVTRLRPQLAWFEARPLFGRRVVVTRAAGTNDALANSLESLGAEVIKLPLIQIQPGDPAALDAALEKLASFDWIAFTSARAVESVFARLNASQRDARAFGNARIACVGPGTAGALAARGLRADLVPEAYTTRALADALAAEGLKEKRILLPRSSAAPPELVTRLREAGADVTEVTAYRTLPAAPEETALTLLAERPADAVLLASASAARAFARNVPERERGEAVYVAIGPATAAACRENALAPVVEAGTHTTAGLVEATLTAAGKPRQAGRAIR